MQWHWILHPALLFFCGHWSRGEIILHTSWIKSSSHITWCNATDYIFIVTQTPLVKNEYLSWVKTPRFVLTDPGGAEGHGREEVWRGRKASWQVEWWKTGTWWKISTSLNPQMHLMFYFCLFGFLGVLRTIWRPTSSWLTANRNLSFHMWAFLQFITHEQRAEYSLDTMVMSAFPSSRKV